MAKAGKPIIGIAGGIGAGKSAVSSILGELGARVVDADRINHEELDSPEVIETLRQWWGDSVVTAEKRARRDVIRSIVRSNPEARLRLEQLMHPRVARRSAGLIAEAQADPAVRIIVWDVPLLFEVGWADQCDRVVFVEADPAVRLERLKATRSWTDEDMKELEKSQKPLDFKRDRADYIVVNNSDRDALRREVESVFSQILSGS